MEKYYKTFKESGPELSDLTSLTFSEFADSAEFHSLDFDSRISVLEAKMLAKDDMIRELQGRLGILESFVDYFSRPSSILQFPFTRYLVSGCYGPGGKFSYVVKAVTYNSIEDILGFDKGMCFSNPEEAALAANKLNSEE